MGNADARFRKVGSGQRRETDTPLRHCIAWSVVGIGSLLWIGEATFAADSVGATPPANQVSNDKPSATIKPVQRTDANSRLGHQQMVDNLRKGTIDLYFVGDSITRRWRGTDYPQFLANWNDNFFGWNAANFGWGGDTIQNILWRMQNGELEQVHPKVIVLLAGTNNIGKNPASDAKIAEVTEGIRAILDLFREKLPDATVVVMGIFPRNDGDDPRHVFASITKINQKIATFADGAKIRYLNINDKLADSDGTLVDGVTVDRLHLSLRGYQIWADALTPTLNELLGAPHKEDLAPQPTGDPSAKSRK
jgi:lysophospholipase L1-like esterase